VAQFWLKRQNSTRSQWHAPLICNTGLLVHIKARLQFPRWCADSVTAFMDVHLNVRVTHETFCYNLRLPLAAISVIASHDWLSASEHQHLPLRSTERCVHFRRQDLDHSSHSPLFARLSKFELVIFHTCLLWNRRYRPTNKKDKERSYQYDSRLWSMPIND